MGLTSTSSNLFLKLEYITVPAVSLTGTLDGPEDSNGLPGDWELFHYGTLGINPNALAPLENGLTNLECYQEGINPPTAATYRLSLTTVTTSTTATLTLNTTNVPSGTTIQSAWFYQGDSLLGTLTSGPYQLEYFLNNTPPGDYPVRVITLDSNGSTASVSGTVEVSLPASNNTNWWYGRANNSDGSISYVDPINFTSGIMPYASGTAEPQGHAEVGFDGLATSFIALQPWVSGTASPSQGWTTGHVPWFLQIASSGAEYYLTGTNSSGPIYSSSTASPTPWWHSALRRTPIRYTWARRILLGW
jgi:hypothetical protein